ncbi:hypothetical protein LSAT2_016596 [Lamellibrachia satsuma]|nr:hypothetical protein LSAT2_016596 [Lamellibrachia satsuma]
MWVPGQGFADHKQFQRPSNRFESALRDVNLSHDVGDVNINRNSIHRQGGRQRARFTKKDELTLDVPLVVHCDRKLMEDLTTKEFDTQT